jgi:hypothetical protein
MTDEDDGSNSEVEDSSSEESSQRNGCLADFSASTFQFADNSVGIPIIPMSKTYLFSLPSFPHISAVLICTFLMLSVYSFNFLRLESL